MELICGYKLWSFSFFLPPLNLKSINWWLGLEVSMTFLSFFFLNKDAPGSWKDMLPRKMVGAPSLEVFKAWTELKQPDLWWGGGGVELDDF